MCYFILNINGERIIKLEDRKNYSKCISEEKVIESMTVRISNMEESRKAWPGLTGATRKEHRGGGQSQYVRCLCPKTLQIYEETSPHFRKLNKFGRELEKKSTSRGRIAKHKGKKRRKTI